MTIPFRETTLRAVLGVVYPNSRGIQRVDQYTFLDVVHVSSLNGAISANISTVPTIKGKGSTVPTIAANQSTQPRRT